MTIELQSPPHSSRSSFARVASFQGVDSRIITPEPVPLNIKMVVEDDLTEKKKKEKMKFNMKVFRFANRYDKILLAVGIIMNLANGVTMVSSIDKTI